MSRRAEATSALAAGDVARAEALLARCVAVDPTDLSSLHDLGVTAARRGRHAEAVERFAAVLARRSDHPEAWLNMALALGDGGRHAEAIDAARKAVALRPRDPNAHTVLGHVLGLTPDLAGAAAACGCALAIDPNFGPAHLRRARILRQMGRFEESLASCDALTRLKPTDTQGQVERGATLFEAGRPAEAQAMFRTVLARDPSSADALLGLSRCLIDADDADGAMAELDRGMGDAETGRLHMLRGLLHQKRGRLQEALAGLKRAIELDPGVAAGYLNMGTLLLKSERWVEAVLFLEHAARLDPTLVEAYQHLAEAHRQLGHQSVTITLLEHAHGLAPERIDLLWMACWARMHGCAWRDYGSLIGDLMARAVAAGHTISPFMIMAFGLPDHETHLWTRAWAEANMPDPAVPLPTPAAAGVLRRHGRIRVGYLSADFRGHATAALVAEVFRLHDRGRFEIYGYNIGRTDTSVLGRDITAGIDRMVDLAFIDDREAALRIAEDDIDILVDLKGFTTDSRPGILSYRAAPIQVNYLGYPGSMATPHVDYIVADAVVAPFAMQPFFDEAIVHLPHSYQPNDRRRPGPDPRATRGDHGLPATGFVFCCFNNNYKLTPLVFGLWMRLLRDVPGSVLWLLQGNDLADLNLRAAAVEHGIDGARIVFARRAIYEQHLARLGLADLFLDTLPVNAHTTASEALWCGVPVLTCMGSHFTSRVAASLLTAVGLPELITTTLADYEREALALARDPARLGALRTRLASNRDTAPLFDTPRYVTGYEAALETMIERAKAGLTPEGFAIEDPTCAGQTDGDHLPIDAAGARPFGEPWEALKDRYCIWIVSPQGYTHHRAFDDIARALSGAFTSLGGSAPVVEHPGAWKGRLPIVLGPQLLTPGLSSSLPTGSIIFNMEQADRNSVWMNETYIALLRRHAVLDYSHRNAALLRTAGVADPIVLPIGYDASLQRIDQVSERDIDVLFYGSLNDRRLSVLNAMIARGMNVVHAFDCYGEARDALIARAKIVLNVHYYESAIFESVRVSLLLANRVCVVTEGDPDDPDLADLKDGMEICRYDELADRCVALLSDARGRKVLADRGYARFVGRPQSGLLRQIVDDARARLPSEDSDRRGASTAEPPQPRKAFIYQSFSGEEQKASLSEHALPFDITFNLGRDTREYECFQALRARHRAENLPDNAFWGLLSGKFELKSNKTLETASSLAEEAQKEGFDGWAFNPMIANAALYENVWQQGIMSGHAGLDAIADYLERLGYPVSAAQGTSTFFLCNYICGNEAFWSGYFGFCEPILRQFRTEASVDSLVGRIYAGSASYGRDGSTGMRPFVIERLLGLYLGMARASGLKIKVYEPNREDFDHKFGPRVGPILHGLYALKDVAVDRNDNKHLLAWSEARMPLLREPALVLFADDPPAWLGGPPIDPARLMS